MMSFKSVRVSIFKGVHSWYTYNITWQGVLSRRSWSPATTGPPGLSAASYVAVDGPP